MAGTEHGDGRAADAAGQAQAQTQGGASAAGEPAAQIAALQAALDKERGIKLELIAERDRRKAIEREAAAEVERKRAEEAAQAGNLKPLVEAAQRERDEARAKLAELESAAKRGAVLRVFERALGGAVPEIAEAHVERMIAAGQIADEASARSAAETMRQQYPALFGGAGNRAPNLGPAAGGRPSLDSLKPGEWASISDEDRRRLVTEATTRPGVVTFPTLHGPRKAQ